MLKVAGHLFIAAAICFAAISVFSGAYRFTSGAQIGRALGAFAVIYLVGIIAACVARMIRGRGRVASDPTSGALTGIVATIVFSALLYGGLVT